MIQNKYISQEKLDVLIDKIKGYKNSPLAIYGTGKHTEALLETLKDININIIGLIDVDEKAGGNLGDYKIYKLNQIVDRVKAIVISSKSYENIIYERIKWVEDQGIEVIRIHNDSQVLDDRNLFERDTLLKIGQNCTAIPEVTVLCNTDYFFLHQYIGGIYNRMDIFVRYMAIEEFYGQNQYGFSLYKKMQQKRVSFYDLDKFKDLIISIEKNGFRNRSKIKANQDFQLEDGSHRLACALFFNIDNVPIEFVEVKERRNYSINWFKDNGFFPEEIDLIIGKAKQVIGRIVSRSYLSKITEILHSEKQQFGRGELYQSFEELGINGQRPTEKRFEIYKLNEYLRPTDNALDIGCNCGFFPLYLSRFLNRVDGIEINPSLIKIANLVKGIINANNCYFHLADFNSYNTDMKYDLILSLAVHHWINMPIGIYGQRLYSMLNDDGMVLFESQNINTIDADFDDKVQEFAKDKFIIEYRGSFCDDGIIPRKFVLLRKNNK